ncbi:MAG TPA: SDR family NAD(P)-dependent oxidoreductase [Burkholderiaceae bacterium]|nr:SDR family NAD(P)-dependent oxidoreductase [Burkholderiaceae bacterium]
MPDVTTSPQKIVIIGATSAIAEQCARLWAAGAPAEMVLVGRDQAKTERVAQDLRVRAPRANITSVEADFHDATAIDRLAASLNAASPVDLVLIAHGSLPDQQQCETDLSACRTALEVNGTSPMLFAEAFAGHMQKAGKGTLAIIGSVAGDRGRKSNYVYGAAKGLVTRYAQGLQHRMAGSGVRIVLIKPGPTDTPMTAHLQQAGTRMASAEDVAQCIVRGVQQGKPVVYAPAKWALIMLVIRLLPAVVFNRLNI